MNRKEFLVALGATGAAGFLSPLTIADTSSGQANPASSAFRAKRVDYRQAYQLAAKPEAIFPLLCPVREYDWIDGWDCRLIYSASGYAEDGCIFQTSRQDPLNPMTWICSRYEPPRRIEYTGLVPDQLTMRLVITLDPTQGGTLLSWARSYTGISESGNERIGFWKEEWDRLLSQKLEHFLATGKMFKEHSPGK